MRTGRAIALGLSFVVPGAMAFSAACSDPAYVYVARRYDPVADCLLPSEGLDVVRGSGSSACPAACLVDTRDGGGTVSSFTDELADAAVDADGDAADAHAGPTSTSAIYVSTMCAPYPVGFDTSGTDPGCAAALEASHAGRSCGDGGND